MRLSGLPGGIKRQRFTRGCYVRDISAPHKFNCIFLPAMRIYYFDIISLRAVIYEAITSRWFISRTRRNKFFFRIPFSKTTFPPLSEFNRLSDISRSRNKFTLSLVFLPRTRNCVFTRGLCNLRDVTRVISQRLLPKRGNAVEIHRVITHSSLTQVFRDQAL